MPKGSTETIQPSQKQNQQDRESKQRMLNSFEQANSSEIKQ